LAPIFPTMVLNPPAPSPLCMQTLIPAWLAYFILVADGFLIMNRWMEGKKEEVVLKNKWERGGKCGNHSNKQHRISMAHCNIHLLLAGLQVGCSPAGFRWPPLGSLHFSHSISQAGIAAVIGGILHQATEAQETSQTHCSS
jgi:hypothetical protein